MNKDHLKGAINELQVAAYYLDQGCQVYFPFVQQGKVDLVVENNGSLVRVQVKTAYPNVVDGHSYLQCRTRSTNTVQRLPCQGDYDTLALVYGHELWLIPASEVTSSSISLRTERKHSDQWHKYKIR